MSNAQPMHSDGSLPSRPFQDSCYFAIFNALTLLERSQCCYFRLSLGEWKHGEIKYLAQGDPKYLFQSRRILGAIIARGASLPPACELQVPLGDPFAPQEFPSAADPWSGIQHQRACQHLPQAPLLCSSIEFCWRNQEFF